MAWLIGGARVLPDGGFGTVLAAQSMYGVLHMVTDNGTTFYGARLAARGDLTDPLRGELVRARLIIGLACAALGLGVAAIGGDRLLAAFAPFAAALAVLPMLNLWEPYGEGNVTPLALYLLLRSLILGVLVGTLAVVAIDAPVEAAGLCELATLVIVGLVCVAWSSPRGGGRVRPTTWRSIRDIGVPAVLTHYNFAVGTVLLGVSGQTGAAATCGVAFRLLTGTQGINGVLGTAIFPRLAHNSAAQDRDDPVPQLAVASSLILAGLAMLGVAIAAPILVSGLLNASGENEEAALIAAMGAAGVAALLLHQSFVLVAGDREARLRRATTSGAAVVTVAAVIAVVIGGEAAVFVVVGGFLVGQGAILFALRHEAHLDSRRGLLLAVVASGVLPAISATLALVESARIPLGVIGGAAGVSGLLVLWTRSKIRHG